MDPHTQRSLTDTRLQAIVIAATLALLLGPAARMSRGQVVAEQRETPLAPVPHLGLAYTFGIHEFASTPDEPFTRSVSGLFNDDPLPDVAVLEGSELRILLNPTDWDAVIAPPMPAEDLDVLHGTAPGGLD